MCGKAGACNGLLAKRARGDRQRAAGQIPPRGNNTDRMQLCSLPKARPISCCDCPAFQRFQTSRFSIAESPNRFPGLMSTPPPEKRFTSVVLHRPIECTAVTGDVKHHLKWTNRICGRKRANRFV